MYEQVIKSEEEQLEEDIKEIKKRQQEKLDKINKLSDFKSKEYSEYFDKAFKRRIIKRDGNKCQLCPRTDDLTVHHIDYNKKNTSDENCITLCRGCNSRVNEKSKRKYYQEYFRKLIHYKLNR